MTRAVVIINPLSGHGRAAAQLQAHTELARQTLRAHGVEADVHLTTKSGDAREVARDAVSKGCDLVVAWGGDGTINETASALVHSATVLGVVPAGSGNGLAMDLRVPFDASAALRLAATGRTMVIDSGEIDGCAFFNIAGVGVDAVIATRFAERGMRRRGPIAYLQLSTTELLRYRCQTYSIEIDGEPVERRALLLAFANGRQYGNRLLIAPGARLDDGLLEVVVVDELSLLSIATRLPSLFRGALQPGRGVTMHAARSVLVRTAGDIPFHVDGEPRLARGELRVSVRPASLRVRVPAA